MLEKTTNNLIEWTGHLLKEIKDGVGWLVLLGMLILWSQISSCSNLNNVEHKLDVLIEQTKPQKP